MQMLKEARPLADCFTVPYREQRMAPWLVIPKLVLHFVSQTGTYSFQFISYARIILFSWWKKKIRAFFLITKHVLTQIFFLYKYICELKGRRV